MVSVGIVFLLGMVETVSISSLLDLYKKDPVAAVSPYQAINIVMWTLDKAARFSAGLLILLASIAGLRGHSLPRLYCYFGIAVFLLGFIPILEILLVIAMIAMNIWLGIILFGRRRIPS